jgi:hypothetical protein
MATFFCFFLHRICHKERVLHPVGFSVSFKMILELYENGMEKIAVH